MPAKKQRSERKAKPSGQVVGRSLDSIVGRDLDVLLAVVSGAYALELWMRGNVGHTVEWPIQILASTEADESFALHMAKLLSNLEKRIRALKRNGPAFRALMGWQARKAYPPNPTSHARTTEGETK